MRALVVEDEAKIGRFLQKGLSEANFFCDVATDGEKGLSMALATDYDLIILDVMLPVLNGFEVLQRLRSAFKQTPVIFVSARDQVQDRVQGLQEGGDDFLVKPFVFSELLARIQAVLRRGPTTQPEELRVGDLEIDTTRYRVTRGGKKLHLTQKEYALLLFLTRRSGEILSRVRIAEKIWDASFGGDITIVESLVARLRAKVDDPFPNKLIHTVRGMGYVLEER